MPDVSSESGKENDLFDHHVSLLPSRFIEEDYGDCGKKADRWWRDESYITAMAIPIL